MSAPISSFRGVREVALRWGSAERVALMGMLLVVLPITGSIFPAVVLAVVPPTLFATWGYWLVGKGLRNDAALVVYAIFGGAMAGYLNTIAALHLYLLVWGDSESIWGLYAVLYGFFGCFHGAAYGLLLLPPLWLARRSRRFHPPEASDRALAGTGSWGLLTLGIAAPLADHIALGSRADLTSGAFFKLWVVSAAGCLLMLVLGAARLYQRRRWLARVRQGRVPGWQVVSPERFDRDTDELPLFCPRLLGRERPVDLVLAETGASQGAYRSAESTPRFRVA